MAKWKKYLLGLALVCAAVFLLWPKSRTVYGISEGIYRMVTEADSAQQPYLYFDMENDSIRFVFGRDMRMSFVYTGTVTLNGRVNLHCENGGEKWVFEVVDNDTLCFVEKDSSAFPLKESTLQDGAVFRYENRE